MLELAQRLGLDLADALAGDRELLADLFERVVGVHADAETHPQHPLLARSQRGEHAGGAGAKIGVDGRIDGLHGVLVLDEVAQMAVLVVADRRVEADRLLGDLQYFAHLLQRHVQLGRQFLRCRLPTDLVQDLARGAHQLVDGLDHMYRDADGAGLVCNRARDCLADPPGGVGRELVAAAVFEFVHGLHQPDIALLDQIQELQAAIGVFLGDGDHEPEVGFDHLLLRAGRFALAFLYAGDNAAEVRQRQFGLGSNFQDPGAHRLDLVAETARECFPFLLLADAPYPALVEFAPAPLFEKGGARQLRARGAAQHAPFQPDQLAIHAVEDVHQLVDARVVELQAAHQVGHFTGQLVVTPILGQRRPLFAARFVETHHAQPGEAPVELLDLVEHLHHMRQQGALRRCKREVGLVVCVVVVARVAVLAVGRLACIVIVGRLVRGSGSICRAAMQRGPGRIEVHDIAEQPGFPLQFLAPVEDIADGGRRSADRADHLFASGFDPLGDGDFALARQQFDRAHLAQVHAHRIVCTTDVIIDIAALFALRCGVALRRRLLGFLRLDDIDAELGEHGHRILDLLGRDLVGRQRRVQFLVGDIAAFLAVLDKLFDGRFRIDRSLPRFFPRLRLSNLFRCLRRHALVRPRLLLLLHSAPGARPSGLHHQRRHAFQRAVGIGFGGFRHLAFYGHRPICREDLFHPLARLLCRRVRAGKRCKTVNGLAQHAADCAGKADRLEMGSPDARVNPFPVGSKP